MGMVGSTYAVWYTTDMATDLRQRATSSGDPPPAPSNSSQQRVVENAYQALVRRCNSAQPGPQKLIREVVLTGLVLFQLFGGGVTSIPDPYVWVGYLLGFFLITMCLVLAWDPLEARIRNWKITLAVLMVWAILEGLSITLLGTAFGFCIRAVAGVFVVPFMIVTQCVAFFGVEMGMLIRRIVVG